MHVTQALEHIGLKFTRSATHAMLLQELVCVVKNLCRVQDIKLGSESLAQRAHLISEKKDLALSAVPCLVGYRAIRYLDF